MEEVSREELRARVISRYTFEELERLEGPADGALILAPGPYPVRPGDWSFVLVDMSHKGSRWVSEDSE